MSPIRSSCLSIVEPTLVAALQRLSVKYRSVVVCRYLLGYSDAETAVALAMRPGTVRSCLHRALRTLALDLGHLRESERHIEGHFEEGTNR